MQYINDPNHESAQQSQLPTRDHKAGFGAGTLQNKDTGAGLVERSMQIQITNPGMRTQQTAPVREEKQRLTARTMDVVARSGNQRPSEVDQRIPDNFIWGLAGTGEDPMNDPPPRPSLWSQLLIGGIGAVVFYYMAKDAFNDNK